MSAPGSGLHGHNSQNLFARLAPIELRPVTELRPYDDNPRQHSQKQLVQLAAAIRAFGFNVPILVDRANQIVAGEARWRAARDLGLSEVPVIRIDHLSDAQVRAYRIADNKLSDLSSFDRRKLAVEFAAVIECGEVEVELTGFEVGEIDLLLEEAAGSNATPDTDPADIIPERQPAISRAGDLWLLNKHRLICGSSREAESWNKLMNGRTAAMLFSDPPFNVPVNGHVSGTGRHQEFYEASGEMSRGEFTDFLHDAIACAAAHIKDGGVADICMDFRHLPELFAAVERAGLAVLNLCVWNKSNAGMGFLYRAKHELVLITKKGKAPHTNNVQLGKNGRYRTNVWDYAGANAFGKTRDKDLSDHPTVKPIALVADAIRDVTQPGEIILDGFMGSGTTLLAAERTGRVGYGIEIEGGYVDVAIRRWEAMTGSRAVLSDTGETFEETRLRRMTEAASASPESEPLAHRVRHRARAIAA